MLSLTPLSLNIYKFIPFNKHILVWVKEDAILAFLVAYTRLAKRMKIPRPVYWMTMIAGGFLLMSLFTAGS